MKYVRSLPVILLLVLCAAELALAQNDTLIPASGAIEGYCDFRSGWIRNPTQEGSTAFACIPVYIGYLVKVMLGFTSGFFFYGIVTGGYKYAILSASQNKQAGRQQIFASVAGLIVSVFAYLIVDLAVNVLT